MEKKLAECRVQTAGPSIECSSAPDSGVSRPSGLTSSETDAPILVGEFDDTGSYGHSIDRENGSDAGKSRARSPHTGSQELIHQDSAESQLPPEQIQREL